MKWCTAKGSLIGKMPGDDWQQFANLRALYGYMWGHPGKKLLFMGGEFAQRREWTHEGELEWWVTTLPEHAGVQQLVRDLNRVYRSEPALHQIDFAADGFEWLDVDDADISVIAFLRKSASANPVLVACNFTPVPRQQLLAGRSESRPLARDPQYGCARIRRRRLGQSRRGRIGARRRPRPRRVDQSHPAAALDDHAALGRPWLKRGAALAAKIR